MSVITSFSQLFSTGLLFLSRISVVLSEFVEHFKQLLYSYDAMHNLDTTTMFIIFWVIFGLFVYAAGNVISLVIKKRKNDYVVVTERKSENKVQEFHENQVKNETLAKQYNGDAYGPDDDCVHWVNTVIKWIYSQSFSNIKPISDSWLCALNLKAHKFTKDHGFFVEFIQIINDESVGPQLSNIKVELESNENISTVCKISTPRLMLIIKVGENETPDDYSEYEILFEKFEGTIKIACITEELLFVIRFVERPDVKVTLLNIKNPQKTLREDIIIDVVLNAITNSVIDLCFSGFVDFPKFHRSITKEPLNDLHFETRERKIFVKVIKANSLGGNKGCTDPYLTIEVDDPPQKSQTSIIKGSSSPVWNEHFIFNLEEQSTELLFELHDNAKTNGNFLGLAIVSVEELKNNPSQKQIITLQPRPLEEDDISGSLTVEFLFMEHGNRSVIDKNSSAVPRSNSPGGGIVESNSSKLTESATLITTTTITKSEQNKDVMSELNDQNIENGIIDEPKSCATIENESNQILELSNTIETLEINSENTDQSQENINQINSNDNQIDISHNIPQHDHSHYQIPSSHTLNPFSSSPPCKHKSPFDPTSSQRQITNPFLIEQSPSILSRAYSIDNFSCLPTIPPIIRRSSLSSIKPFRLHQTVSPNFKGNPFHSISSYRKRSFIMNTLHSMPSTLFQPPFRLPPSPLFPSENYQCHRDEMQKRRLSTNPFTQELHSNSVSPLSSVESIVGIDSGGSNENVYFDCDNIVLKESSPVILKKECERVKFSKYPIGSKPNKPPPLPPTECQMLNPTENYTNIKTNVNGDGMTHESINLKYNYGSDDFDLTETPINEIEGKFIFTNANKSTLKIHGLQHSSENGSEEGYGTGRTTPSSQLTKVENDPTISGDSTLSMIVPQKDDRSRSRSRDSRSIIRALRKRFSFNKNRSKSVEQRMDVEESISRDSSVSVSSDRAKSMPGSREPSSPKDVNKLQTPSLGENGKIESFSNLSEISGFSTRTFVHEKSTLVVEAVENAILKHYIVPLSLAHKTKWRKRGMKLHLFNEHTFVAKHLSGTITCRVCSKTFSRRPGKQGYECRDCNYYCHKRCHVYVEVPCPSSKISFMNFETVIDPKTSKTINNHINHNNDVAAEC